MATKFAVQQQGVADGSAVPADKADGRQVNANKTVIIASKPTDEAWNSGDAIYLGKKGGGTKIIGVSVIAGASLGTSTIDIGEGGDPTDGGAVDTVDSIVDGATVTTADRVVSIGPKASIADDEPSDEETGLWATIGVANIAAATTCTILIELAGIQ